MTMVPPRVAVIGAGPWGRNHVRSFHALGTLTAFAEADAQVRGRIAAEYPDARPYDDAIALLQADDVDAVVIATPAATHGRLADISLRAGKHVFVEKPLCLDIAEGRRLTAFADDSRLTLMVGHLLLYHPVFRVLKRLVSDGALGDLRYLYSNRANLGRIRREENSLWSFAPHDISMILSLAGVMPERVFASETSHLTPGVADTTLSHLWFPEGINAHIFVSWLHPYKEQRMVVVGSEAMAVFDDVAAAGEKLKLYRHEVAWSGEIPVINRAKGEEIAYDPVEPLREECAAFLDAITTGTRPPSDAQEGMRVLHVLDACQRSITDSRPVDIDVPY